MSYTVRPARREDVEGLKTIWRELMQMHEDYDRSFALARDSLQKWQHMVEDMLERDDTFVLVAIPEGSNEVVGFCLGWVARNPPIYRTPEVGFVSELAVAKRLQRTGIGRALMAQARAWFAARDLPEFQLSTAVWNEPARAFWQALGGQPLLVRYRFDV